MLTTYQKIILFIRWLWKGKPMPPPDYIKEKIIKRYARRYNSKTFIETGTYYGDKIQAFKNLFSKIYSVELDNRLYEQAKQRFKGSSNIEILHGDSSKILLELLPGIRGTILFWLDAHYSGGVTARGKDETPILNELKAIMKIHPNNNIILVDDARLFDGNDGYPTINTLIDYVKRFDNSNITYTVINDIISITLL